MKGEKGWKHFCMDGNILRCENNSFEINLKTFK